MKWDGIDHGDAPDYCDAYIVSADMDGVPMTPEQIEAISDSDRYALLMAHLH